MAACRAESLWGLHRKDKPATGSSTPWHQNLWGATLTVILNMPQDIGDQLLKKLKATELYSLKE